MLCSLIVVVNTGHRRTNRPDLPSASELNYDRMALAGEI